MVAIGWRKRGGSKPLKFTKEKHMSNEAEKQEPVAWMHTKLDGVVVPHRPADLSRHPDRWEALYKTPPPCPTCEALARTVMLDQTYHDNISPQRTWVGLTDEEKRQILLDDPIDWINAIEAKLREKNNGT